MPSNRWHAAGVVLALVVFAYSILIVGSALTGVLAAGLVYLLGWLVAVVSPERVLTDMGSTRARATGVLALAVLAYAVVVATQILLGVVVVTLLVLVSWLTAPNGPLVRGARWLRDLRADLRAVREAVDDGPDDDAQRGDTEPADGD